MSITAPVFERPEISLIAEDLGPDRVKLFISGTEGARDVEALTELGVSTVINCAVNLDINYVDRPNLPEAGSKRAAGTAPFRTYKIGLVDGDGNPQKMMLGAYYILESALDQSLPRKASYAVRHRGNILVHCRGGRSRSVALVALFLHLQKRDLYPTLADAIAHVRVTRELQREEWFETPKQVLTDAAQHAADAIDLLDGALK
jgi:hypothetical protein